MADDPERPSSRSPPRQPAKDRSSRSPPPRRDGDRPKKSGGGFRWKDERRRERSRSPGRDGYQRREDRDRYLPGRYGGRDRDRERERDRDGFSRRRGDDRWNDAPDRYRERAGRDEDRRNDRSGDGYGKRARSPPRGPAADKEKPRGEKKEKPAPAPAPAVASGGEPMIIVHVNDRLGTKAAIPCLASDPIKLFKAQVAARIGRQPHEILLKRQGERPFKDQLTLEDYGVSNGVQLDLELDTGD